MADVRLNLLVVALFFVALCSVGASTCNVHSGIQHYTCTKYSQVKYSQAYQCGFWHWNRCYRTKYSHTAHQSTCTRKCKVNGAWTSWQAWGGWSICDKTCGDGQRIRYSVRQCSNPTPKNGGEYCNGTNVQKETEECLLKVCIVDGGWSEFGSWSKFSQCAKTCGWGAKTRYRYRECNNPKPQNGGRFCPGDSIHSETAPCNTNSCEDYGLNYPNQIADTGNNSENTTNDTPPEVNGFDNSSMEEKNSSDYLHNGIQSPIKSVKDFSINGTATPNHNKVATTASSSITTSQNKT
ncbi:semaphorin-5A [Magallana gigas]|uniref:semaphorin-5A n=1 Tax=Magallana gigas TaxID=29159 RepID=UPI00333E94E4